MDIRHRSGLGDRQFFRIIHDVVTCTEEKSKKGLGRKDVQRKTEEQVMGIVEEGRTRKEGKLENWKRNYERKTL